MRVFQAIGLLLLINSQVNSLPTTLEEKDIDTKYEEWLNNEVEAFINHEALEDLKSWKELIALESYQQGIEQLQILKKASVKEFLSCDRLKKGIENIGQMLKETYNITVDVTKLVQDVATGLASCATGSTFTAPFCVGKYIWNFTNQIKQLIPVMELYKLDIKKLASEIKEIYNYCSTHKD